MMTRAQPRGGPARLATVFKSAAPWLMPQWSPQNALQARQTQARKVAAEESGCESAARDGRSHIPWDCGQRQSA
jgi:hypothetical protein